MLKFGLTAAAITAALACLQMTPAVAHDSHDYGNYAYTDDSGMLVDTQGDEQNNDDVDTIVTPYGYTPYDRNGYYQGYGYNPQYAYNPYYAAAAYSHADPVSAAVVSTVLTAAQGGRVEGRDLIGALVGGILQSQMQDQYRDYPAQYAQPVYYQPQYVRQPYVVRYERHRDREDEHRDGGDEGDD